VAYGAPSPLTVGLPIMHSETFHSADRGRKVWKPAYSILVHGIWNYFASRKWNLNSN